MQDAVNTIAGIMGYGIIPIVGGLSGYYIALDDKKRKGQAKRRYSTTLWTSTILGSLAGLGVGYFATPAIREQLASRYK